MHDARCTLHTSYIIQSLRATHLPICASTAAQLASWMRLLSGGEAPPAAAGAGSGDEEAAGAPSGAEAMVVAEQLQQQLLPLLLRCQASKWTGTAGVGWPGRGRTWGGAG